MTLAEQVLKARDRSVPLIAISTPDPTATIEEIKDALNGNIDIEILFRWDVVSGLAPMTDGAVNAASALRNKGVDVGPIATGNPVEAMLAVAQMPPETIVFAVNIHRYIEAERTQSGPLVQAIANLRDVLETQHAMLVMLGPTFALPVEIAQDVLPLKQPLPRKEQLGAIFDDVLEGARQSGIEIPVPEGDARERRIESLLGLSAFSAKQSVALALDADGVDLKRLIERKRSMIRATDGLDAYVGPETFSTLGGLANLKAFMLRIIDGRMPPLAVMFMDELEKMVGGGGELDGGVARGMLGILLAFMQDSNARGILITGIAGTGKSAITKAYGNEAGVPTLLFNTSAMKRGIVGQSEQTLNACLATAEAISQGRLLIVATTNNPDGLPPELRSRFTLGTFFVDLPNDDEKPSVWQSWLSQTGLSLDSKRPNDNGWSGREIKQCAMLAADLDMTLDEAAQFVVPVSVSAADKIKAMREAADGKYIAAAYPGVYRASVAKQTTTQSRRAIRA
jgi:hypothetical protein